MAEPLPIHSLREAFLAESGRRPMVVTAPTGTGKSTEVPRWCAGRVLVVEPRRVACKTLALRVAELEGSTLGDVVGFHVRDHRVESGSSRLLFVTPGIALRRFDDVLSFDWVVLDEFHERTLEVDLLLALLRTRRRGRLVVMSATLRAARLREYLQGAHLAAQQRLHPVETRYLPTRDLLPDARELATRVVAAVDRSEEHAGDVLVFLPGKAEIAAVGEALRPRRSFEVLELHGGLTLEEQARAFAPSARRKLVLATNVAETSITVPGIGVVIDSGLVRRTRYHRGRGFLTLMPVAADSAEQRAGRAGRTAPGVCFRLWSEAARLEPSTPPEIRRESLLPLVLAAAACDAAVGDLEFLDAPADYAVEAACEEGRALGALDESARLTRLGRELFGLPLDAPLGRLLVEARRQGTLEDAVDLVAVLAVGRRLFRGPASRGDDERDLRSSGCDATALIAAVRRGEPARDGLSRHVLQEARAHARRLRRAFGLRGRARPDQAFDRKALAMTALAADPRCAHVARHRRGRTAWSNGGTELELARESAAVTAERAEALVVLETRALGKGWRRTRIVATCAMPVALTWLVEAGLGRERVVQVELGPDGLVAQVERVFARKVIDERATVPRGELARRAIVRLLLEGRLFPAAVEATRVRLRQAALVARLPGHARPPDEPVPEALRQPPTLEQWLEARLAAAGVEDAADLPLLSPGDVEAPELPWAWAHAVAREFPDEVCSRDARYVVEIDLAARQVTLRWVDGQRGRCPELSSLPGFGGFRVRVETGHGVRSLR